MEFSYNRRLLLLNQNIHYSTSTTTNNTSSLSYTTTTTTTVFGNPLQTLPPSIFSSNVVYFFIIILTSLLILICVILYCINRYSSSHQKRVDPTVIAKSLPSFAYRRDDKHEMDDCAICLEEFREGEKVKMIVYCKHVFHPHCIDTWIAQHVTCPICRCHKLCEGKVVEENGDRRH